VLFHRAPDPSAEDLAVILHDPGVQVVDRTSDRAFLVETTEDSVAQLRSKLPGWVIEEETIHPPPG
jgi:hypothetical protein